MFQYEWHMCFGMDGSIHSCRCNLKRDHKAEELILSVQEAAEREAQKGGDVQYVKMIPVNETNDQAW